MNRARAVFLVVLLVANLGLAAYLTARANQGRRPLPAPQRHAERVAEVELQLDLVRASPQARGAVLSLWRTYMTNRRTPLASDRAARLAREIDEVGGLDDTTYAARRSQIALDIFDNLRRHPGAPDNLPPGTRTVGLELSP